MTFAQPIGLQSSLRLSLYYALFFLAALSALFVSAYLAIQHVVRDSEIEIVEARAADCKNWWREGGWNMLTARFEDLGNHGSDVMFARVSADHSPDKLVHLSIPSDAATVTLGELGDLNSEVQGSRISISSVLGDDFWTVVSDELESGVTIQVGKHSSASEKLLAQFRRIFLLGAIPTALIGAAGGALFVFKLMAPIRQLAGTMQSIVSTGDFEKRANPIPSRNELNVMVEVFNELLKRNQRLISSMRNSLDSVAHDLRTPLTRLRNKSERALSGSSEDEVGTLREAVEAGLEESEHLQTMLEELMDLAEAETGVKKLNKESFSLLALIANVVELYDYVAEDKHMVIETELPDTLIVQADRNLLQRAIANLFDNAIKYSEENARIYVGADADNETVNVTVRDEGKGIADDQLPYIWDRLYRADSSRTTRGLGLGLSFVRAIVLAHDGTVEVESELNKGSRFTIRLPLV